MPLLNLKILGREPAWWLTLGGLVVVLLGTVLPGFSPVQQGWFNGIVAAVVGLVIALGTHDGMVAAVAGLVKSFIVVISGYGLIPVIHTLNGNQQLAVYAVLSFISAAYLRTQLSPTVPPFSAAVVPVQIVERNSPIVTRPATAKLVIGR